MQQYLVKFIGHLIEWNRPNGFPTEVVFSNVIQADDEYLKKYINYQAAIFIQQHGMVVPKPGVPEEQGTNKSVLDGRVFIPMTNIAYIETETKLLTTNMPEEGDPNVSRWFM